MNFLTILNRQFDPIEIAKNVTSHVKLSQFINETDKFDDLFELAFDYEKVEKQVAAQFSPEELIKFNQ